MMPLSLAMDNGEFDSGGGGGGGGSGGRRNKPRYMLRLDFGT